MFVFAFIITTHEDLRNKESFKKPAFFYPEVLKRERSKFTHRQKNIIEIFLHNSDLLKHMSDCNTIKVVRQGGAHKILYIF